MVERNLRPLPFRATVAAAVSADESVFSADNGGRPLASAQAGWSVVPRGGPQFLKAELLLKLIGRHVAMVILAATERSRSGNGFIGPVRQNLN